MPKKSKSKKFKGTPSWKKHSFAVQNEGNVDDLSSNTQSEAEDLSQDSGDRDRNPTLKTASARKLESFYSEHEVVDETSDVNNPDTGYRFVDLASIKQACQDCHNCDDAEVTLLEDTQKRYGQSFVYTLECSKCNKQTVLQTSKSTGLSWQPKDAIDINKRLVYAASETGIGREGLATILDILNMPQPMSTKTWNDHSIELYKAHKTAIENHFQSTRSKVRSVITKDKPDISDDTVVEIPVTFDGTWSKRGHTANYGFGFVLSVDTGEVLDYGFKSKVCWECNSKKGMENSEYQAWYEEHKKNCSKNFEGSSGSMEVEIARDLWARSKDFNIFYKYMVCDGDSKAYSAVWDVYGCCDTCKKYENMDRQSAEYKKWRESASYLKWKIEHEDETVACNRVVKLDCIGHVQKRLGTALRELKRKTKGKLADGKAVGGKGHRLSDKTIDKLQEYYGKAIRSNVNRNAASTKEMEVSVKKMMKAVWAVLYHCVIQDDEQSRHKFCPDGEESWCSYKRTGKKLEDKSHYLDPIFLEFLKPIFKRLSDRTLLLRCLPGYTQNQNECLNSVVWSKAPKHKFKGPKAIERAGMSAVLQFDCGQQGRQEVMSLAEIPCGHHTVEGAKRKDRKRLYDASRQADEVQKRIRIAKRQAKLIREEEAVEREGGPSYACGAFNEESVVQLKTLENEKKKKGKKKK